LHLRDHLVSRIAACTRRMFEEGLIDEVRGCWPRAFRGRKALRIVGYKQVLAYLRGQTTLEQAQESTEIETRQR
jgi:tRNA dimethylallyltransferase